MVIGDLTCENCGRHFKSTMTLAGHQRWESRQGAQTAPSAAAPGHIHCPVCGAVTPYYIGDKGFLPVVCENCLCLFHCSSGWIEQAPPIKCDAELLGYPCPHPSHIAWGRKYAERLAQHER